MTDPRVPEGKAREAQLPDDLDQVPGEDRPDAETPPRGSEDAQLLAAAQAGEEEVAAEAAADD